MPILSEGYMILMRLVCFVVITRMLLLILPGKKYYVYMKLIIGFCIIILIISYMNRLLSGYELQDNPEALFQGETEKEKDKKMSFDKYAKLSDLSALSMCENKIRTLLNKEFNSGTIGVELVKIKVCEDAENENYGKIIEVTLQISSNTVRSDAISVDTIIIGKDGSNLDYAEVSALRKRAAEMIEIEEACVKIVR